MLQFCSHSFFVLISSFSMSFSALSVIIILYTENLIKFLYFALFIIFSGFFYGLNTIFTCKSKDIFRYFSIVFFTIFSINTESSDSLSSLILFSIYSPLYYFVTVLSNKTFSMFKYSRIPQFQCLLALE